MLFQFFLFILLFYVSNIILRVLVAAVIVYWIYYIINTIKINDAFRMAFSRKISKNTLAIANSAAALSF